MSFIETLNNPIFREIQKDYNRAIAQKIRNRLQQLENANDKDKRRWIWELLQNANDTVSDRRVDIEVIFSEKAVEFRHNGNYFSPRNITNLVHQISSKEGTESIGRFGTGFLTTHTLSKIVEVEGIYTENEVYNQFKIYLDRNGNSETALVERIEKTWKTFESIELEAKPKAIFWSSFKYVNPDKDIAERSIEDFMTFIHYNLAFVPSIGKVTVRNDVVSNTFCIQRKTSEKINDELSILTFELSNGEVVFNRQLLIAKTSKLQTAIGITQEEQQISIKPIASNIPRLFCAFPLIGTESFQFPMIVNSRFFMPKTERDGLFLKGNTKETATNKPLFQQDALLLYKKVLDYFSQQKAENLYLLAQHKNQFRDDYFDLTWYRHSIEKVIQHKLLETPVVKTAIGQFITVKNAIFPFFIKNNQINETIIYQLWDYQSALYPEKIPQRADVLNWAKIIWVDSNKGNLKVLAQKLHDFESVQVLRHKLVDKTLNIFEWLNSVIGLYVKENQLLLDKYKIVPNQREQFYFKKELFFDNQIPKPIKDVHQILADDWRLKLAHIAISTIHPILRAERKIHNIHHLVQSITTKIQQAKAAPNSVVQKAVFQLVRILPSKKEANFRHRQELLLFAKDLFKAQIPTKIELQNLPSSLWQAADIWLLHHIARTIQSQGNITKLIQVLQKKDLDEGKIWLNYFFEFLTQKTGNIGRNILAQYTIIPNQKNNFRLQKDLYFDNNIPEPLKDVYEIFGKIWRNELLSLQIPTVAKILRSNRKVRNTNNIIQGINAKIEHPKTDIQQVQKAVFHLSSLHPPTQTKANTQKYSTYRKDIYRFAENLFKSALPEIIELEQLPNLAWKSSDDWLLKHIVTTIENHKTVTNLGSHLGLQEADEVVDWMNDFFIFCLENDKEHYLAGKKIYPNQLGDFDYKATLYEDKAIAEDLKEILKNLDMALSIKGVKGWRHLLLDKGITAFKEHLKFLPKTTKDISDEINKKIPSLNTNPSNEVQTTIFKLATLAKSENRHQRKLWEYLRTFYLDAVPKQITMINNANDFDWQPCFLWCVECLVKDITTLRYIDELEDTLHGNVNVMDWLGDFIDFIHETETYKKLLDGEAYAILPNQNNRFQVKNRLWLDNGIDENLKEVIQLLNSTWLDNILEKSIFLDLPKERERTTADAALEVDKIFRSYADSTQKAEYVRAWRILSPWMKKQDTDFIHQHMDWVDSQKAHIALSIFGSDKEKDEIYAIIESDKRSILSKIANDGRITEEDLETLANNPQRFKSLVNFIKNPPKLNSSRIPLKSFEEKVKDAVKVKTSNEINSLDDLVNKYKNLKKQVEQQKLREEASKPKFIVRTERKGGSTDWEAVKRSNKIAREAIYKHLDDHEDYDVSGWTPTTKTIIEKIKKNGIFIGLVTKGADNGIIYFNSAEKAFLSDTKKFTELWAHIQGKVYRITIGEILKTWNIQSIKTKMFDLH